jgi:hypothetical protein
MAPVLTDTKVEELRSALTDEELEKSFNFTLADLMREGATVTKQKIGGWASDDGEELCALSAAALAAKARRLI